MIVASPWSRLSRVLPEPRRCPDTLMTNNNEHHNKFGDRSSVASPVWEQPESEHGVWDLHVVAMDKRETQAQEANYLFFVASVGMALNLLVIIMIGFRRSLRKMTSAFMIHSGCLNFMKAAFCIPFGLNLLSSADETKGNQPPDCVMQGSGYIVVVTTSAINMVAMICTEAYTFGEINVGGNSRGTSCCILFGLLVVYITSVILHLGPTLIGGSIVYNPDIGSCAFQLGSVAGYVGNVMWIVIISISFMGVGFFLRKLYKEIQMNCPNRVSMLVRHSITISSERGRRPSAYTVHEMTQEAMHRAKIFLITAIAFALCWYPLFLLIIIDINFRVSPKVYQAFSFIAWTEAMVEPIILICFDRNINILARFLYCDRDQYTATQIAFLLSHGQNPHLGLGDHNDVTSLQNSTHAEHAFHRTEGHTPDSALLESTMIPCCHCSSMPPGESTPLRPSVHHRPAPCMYETAAATSCSQELRAALGDYVPQVEDDHGLEMTYTTEAAQQDLRHQADLEIEGAREDDVQC